MQYTCRCVALNCSFCLYAIPPQGLRLRVRAPLHAGSIAASQSQIMNQKGATSGFEMCFAPSTFAAGGKTHLESGIKTFKPHLCNS